MIRLDEDTHTYYWDGSKVPGVTEVLTRVGIAQYPDLQVLRDARYRGTVVHRAIELYLKGTLDEQHLSSEPSYAAMNVVAYLDAAKRYIDKYVAKIVRYEMVVGHQIWRYGGKLDLLVVTRDSRLVVLDWKTGSIPWFVELQTGAYLEAILSDKSLELESNEIWHGAVRLDSDGAHSEPRLSKDRKSFDIFRQALNVVNYTDRKGRLR